MPTIAQIFAARDAKKSAADPATAAMHAGNNALAQLRTLPDPDDPPPRQPATPPARVAPVPLPSPVKLIGEGAALARLFPALAAATVGTTAQDSHAARAEWLRSALPAAVAEDSASQLNRELPHPSEPTAPCDLVAIAGYANLLARCPSCGYRVGHELVAGVPLSWFSRRTCAECGLPYWITSGDHMPFPRARRRKWIESSQKGKCRPVPLRDFEKLNPPPP